MMKLFEASDGYIFAFGFNMITRKPDAHRICWCDPSDKSWDVIPTNRAGSVFSPVEIKPEFVRELQIGCILAYQPGWCFELLWQGPPEIWRVTSVRAEDWVGLNEWAMGRLKDQDRRDGT